MWGQHLLCLVTLGGWAEHKPFSAPLRTGHLLARRDRGTSAVPPLWRDPPRCPVLGPQAQACLLLVLSSLCGTCSPPQSGLPVTSAPGAASHLHSLLAPNPHTYSFSGAVGLPGSPAVGYTTPVGFPGAQPPTAQPLRGPYQPPTPATLVLVLGIVRGIPEKSCRGSCHKCCPSHWGRALSVSTHPTLPPAEGPSTRETHLTSGWGGGGWVGRAVSVCMDPALDPGPCLALLELPSVERMPPICLSPPPCYPGALLPTPRRPTITASCSELSEPPV